MSDRQSLLTLFLRKLIWIYQHTLSLVFRGCCRFRPTCSAYADEALRLHGAIKGTELTIKRLLRCNPWGGHGYDPVPPAITKKRSDT